jgi:hypothetical protein
MFLDNTEARSRNNAIDKEGGVLLPGAGDVTIRQNNNADRSCGERLIQGRRQDGRAEKDDGCGGSRVQGEGAPKVKELKLNTR